VEGPGVNGSEGWLGKGSEDGEGIEGRLGEGRILAAAARDCTTVRRRPNLKLNPAQDSTCKNTDNDPLHTPHPSA
jgi:hypothetical protein